MSTTKRVLLLIPAILALVMAFAVLFIAGIFWVAGSLIHLISSVMDICGDILSAGATILPAWIPAVYADKKP